MHSPSDNPEESKSLNLAQFFREDAQVSAHDAAAARNAAQHFLKEKTRLGIPAIFQGEALARIYGLRQHQLSAGAGAGQHLGSGTGAAGFYALPGMKWLPRSQPGLLAGAGFVARPALGTNGRNLWRRSLSGRAHGRGRDQRDCRARPGISTGIMCMATMKHFAAARPAGKRHQHGPCEFFGTRLARDFSRSFPGRGAGGSCGKRDGLLQRDRRHPFAHQPLAARTASCARSGASADMSCPMETACRCWWRRIM